MNRKPKFVTVLKIVLALGAVFLPAGCKNEETVNLGVYDPNVPADQRCTLEIAGNISVTSFNGAKVRWSRGAGFSNGGSDKQAVIQIPSGTHEMLTSFVMSYTGGTGSVSLYNIKVTDTFIAGRTYRLTAILTYADGETAETWTTYADTSNPPKSIAFHIIDTEIQRGFEEAFRKPDETHQQ